MKKKDLYVTSNNFLGSAYARAHDRMVLEYLHIDPVEAMRREISNHESLSDIVEDYKNRMLNKEN